MNILKIANELKENIREKIKGEPNKTIIYGSFARNEGNKNSDLDILIIFNSLIDWQIKDKVFEICSDLNVKYEIWIDVSFLSLSEMDTIKGKQPFVQNALYEGIEV